VQLSVLILWQVELQLNFFGKFFFFFLPDLCLFIVVFSSFSEPQI
jgi:hypothetical protein